MESLLEETLTPLLEDVVRPISSDNPVGEDITYDEDFQALKDQIDQISSVNPEGVDYNRIVATCRALLGQKAKDLRVSAYLAMALGRTEGYRGVWEGLRAQQVLVDSFWEAMYPPVRRMRARQGAFQFMAERLVDIVSGGSPTMEDRSVLEASLGVLQEVQGFVMEVMGDQAPLLSGLRKALEDALRRAPKPDPAAAPALPTPAPEAAPVATVSADLVATPQDEAASSEEEEEGDSATALLEQMTPLLEDVVRPISSDNPVGEDITYDEDFQALKDQIDQISSVNPEGVDYNRIVATCRALLGQKAKDLRVSMYLAMALGRTEGYRGVWEGLRAQQVLVDSFWEAMYPPVRRMRARQGAFQFMAERLVDIVSGGSPTMEDRSVLEASLGVLQEVQGFVMEVMGDQAPLLSGLRKALEDALRRIPKPAPPKPQPDPAAKPRQEAESPRQSASPVAMPVAAGEPQSESEAVAQVLSVAVFLRAQDPTNPLAYRLARCALWDSVSAEPTNQKGATVLEDLAPHRLTYLNTLAEGADWATLLSVAEDIFRELPYHLLLDLQRFVVAAMDGLGAAYQPAKQVVLYETALFLKRLPGLSRLAFMRGMPFADPATQFWIEQTVEPVLASGSGDGLSGEDDKALASQYDEAKKLFSEGDLGGALQVLQEGLKQDGSPRSRFRRRFYMALLCMQANQAAIACSILENLDVEIEQYSLHAWDPALALEVWNYLYRCYDLLRGAEGEAQDGLEERARRVFAKISKIDVTQALKASGI